MKIVRNLNLIVIGIILTISCYSFGQENDPHVYVVQQAITKTLPAYSNLADYSLKTDWSKDIPSSVDIEYTIDFENQTLRKKVDGTIISRKFTRIDSSESGYDFVISFENEDYELVYLYLNDGEINDPYNFTEWRPFFLEINTTSSKVLAYTTFSH